MSAASTALSAFPSVWDVAPARRTRPGPLARLTAAVQDARMRQAEREVARFVERSGNSLNDRTEREIERRFA